MKITVLGAGAWGTALAMAAASDNGTPHTVQLWARDARQVQQMRLHGSNERYLPGLPFPPGLQVVEGDVADVINRAGFPPVHLSEINFQAMYEQQQAEAAGALQ